MNDKSLEKNLANLERELLALQTAHDIGLGSIVYWEYDANTSYVPYQDFYAVYMCIEVVAGERLDPLMNYYMSEKQGFFPNLLKSDTYPGRYLFAALSLFSGDCEIKIVSSSKINYHFASTIEEAKEWIDWQE